MKSDHHNINNQVTCLKIAVTDIKNITNGLKRSNPQLSGALLIKSGFHFALISLILPIVSFFRPTIDFFCRATLTVIILLKKLIIIKNYYYVQVYYQGQLQIRQT